MYNDGLGHYEAGILSAPDSTSHITYPAGNETVPGKFLMVSNSVNSHGNDAYNLNHPTYTLSYEKWVYDFPNKTHKAGSFDNSTVATTTSITGIQTVHCVAPSTTISVSSSATNEARMIQTFTGDSNGEYMVIDDPFTYSCSGAYC